jgi:hypothetical protein
MGVCYIGFYRLIYKYVEALTEMLIAVNYAYEFTMNSTLSVLDGIYTVSSVLSYTDMIAQNLDLFALTYQTNNLTEDNFNSDLDQIRVERILKLISVDDESIIVYIPEHFLRKVPDGSVQKYLQLGLAINLGIFDDADQLSVIRSEVEQVIAAMAGVSNKTIVYTVKNKWMTESEYASIDTERKAEITRTKNHYTDKLELTKQVDSLKTLITYYEEALKKLSN